MWKYVQSSGALIGPDGKLFRVGYSGAPPSATNPLDGKNKPDLQEVEGVGPIPRGWWRIVGPPFTLPRTRRDLTVVLQLEPEAETRVFRRTGFLIHGGNAAGTASTGCIIIDGPVNRQAIWDSGDRRLLVVRDTSLVSGRTVALAFEAQLEEFRARTARW